MAVWPSTEIAPYARLSPEPELSNAIKERGARQRHVETYAAIQKSYKALAKQVGEDNRLDTTAAVPASRRWSKLASTTNRMSPPAVTTP